MYSPAIGSGPVMDYLGETAINSLKGEDIIKVVPQTYSSTVQYPNTPIARKLKGIAQTHIGEIGSRIFYCDHSTFDTHAGQSLAILCCGKPCPRASRRSSPTCASTSSRQRHRAAVLGVRASRP